MTNASGRQHYDGLYRQMNFSGISNEHLLGKVLRLPLKLFPSQMKLPVLQGGLKGKRWIVGSHTHGCWLGSYERDKQLAFYQTITSGSVVFDVGANVGFYTLLASSLVGPEGHVYAFEPAPRNLQYLREHLRINRVTNATVIEAAVSHSVGVGLFSHGPTRAMGHLSTEGDVEVKTVTLDDLVYQKHVRPPDYLKIDVEGNEFDVLTGAESTLSTFRPDLFLATHGPEVHKRCCELLKSYGYELHSLNELGADQTDELFATANGRARETRRVNGDK
jgi:FkbM family methyltransferase